jgi:hypothetical protein
MLFNRSQIKFPTQIKTILIILFLLGIGGCSKAVVFSTETIQAAALKTPEI